MEDKQLFRVAPDGVVIDMFGEFLFERPERLRNLYDSNPIGYVDAVKKIVQTLGSAETILGADELGAAETTLRVKEILRSARRIENAEFFTPEARKNNDIPAMAWLRENWDLILAELDKDDSMPEQALSGHVNREFYLYWLKIRGDWGKWYLPIESCLPLPEKNMSRLLRSVNRLVIDSGRDDITEDALRSWIGQVISTHYKNFAEYWLFLGKKGDEYMPALTRSSLRFLQEGYWGKNPSLHGSVERLVMPFIGLEALEKVKERNQILDRVLEWSTGKGKDIVDGLRQLQMIVRGVKDENEKKELLADIGQSLNSKLSRRFQIILSLIKLASSTVKGEPDIKAAAEAAIKLGLSKSYRWLWKIREPYLEDRWKARLEELL